MTNFLFKIKLAYQRVTRGWDETATWGMDGHFVEVVIPPLKAICQRDIFQCPENQSKIKVFKKTLELIAEYETCSHYSNFRKWDMAEEALQALAVYFAKNLYWYWD